MIVTTLILSFLLSLLPLVIGAFSLRYAANFYSRGIVALSTVSFFLGLTQFSLLLGTFYRLFPASFMKQAATGIQYINIIGGIVMIIAGLLWLGYFRTLMRARARASAKSPAPAQQPVLARPPAPLEPIVASESKPKTPRPRRKKTEPAPDWFSDELLPTPAVRLAAKVAPKRAPRSKSAPKPPKD